MSKLTPFAAPLRLFFGSDASAGLKIDETVCRGKAQTDGISGGCAGQIAGCLA
jgi:hypothetical protein